MAKDSLHAARAENMLRAFSSLRVLLPAIFCALALQTPAFAQYHPYHSSGGVTHSSTAGHSSTMPHSFSSSAVSEVIGNSSTSSAKELSQLERSSLVPARSAPVTRAAARSNASLLLQDKRSAPPINFTGQAPRTYNTHGGTNSGRGKRAR